MLRGLKDRIRAGLGGMLTPEVEERIAKLNCRLNEFGVDPFGLDPGFVRNVLPLVILLYRKYFRVQTRGIQNVPQGRALLVANHSGQIPLDAMMIVLSVFLEAEPPRIVRSMVETWAPTLPVVSYFFHRTGQIVGTRENGRRLLDQDEAILSFPEGVRGISKTFEHRYELQRFGSGFMRLALMTNAPIVPVAVVGAEEQAPSFWDGKPIAKRLGLPALPFTPTFPWLGPLGLLPYPSKYHIYFGSPMYFQGDPNDEDGQLAVKVRQIRKTIQKMLWDGLKARKHVFW